MILGNEEQLLRLFAWVFIDLMIRGSELVTSEFELVTCGFALVIRGFKLVTREFELVTCGFEIVTCGFELTILYFNSCFLSLQLAFLSFQLVTRNSQLVIRVSPYHHLTPIVSIFYKYFYIKELPNKFENSKHFLVVSKNFEGIKWMKDKFWIFVSFLFIRKSWWISKYLDFWIRKIIL